MNIYFLKDTEDDFIMWTITAKTLHEMERILNHYLTNLHQVNDYERTAELSEEEDNEVFVRVYDKYKDESNWYPSAEYRVLVRQYSPDRVYDLV